MKNWFMEKTLMGQGKGGGERLKAGEGDDRGWDSWMASLTQWTWVWASSRSWWWTGKPGVLQSMESQRFRHNWVTELTELLSHVWFFVTPWTAASQAPLSMWFSREEYWSGLPFPPPGHLPDPEIKPMSPPWQTNSLPLSYLGIPSRSLCYWK